jgi:hypothetical protein
VFQTLIGGMSQPAAGILQVRVWDGGPFTSVEDPLFQEAYWLTLFQSSLSSSTRFLWLFRLFSPYGRPLGFGRISRDFGTSLW